MVGCLAEGIRSPHGLTGDIISVHMPGVTVENKTKPREYEREALLVRSCCSAGRMVNCEYVGFIIANTEDTVVVMMPASLCTDTVNTHHEVNTLSNTNRLSHLCHIEEIFKHGQTY
jgi:hypothetical protein